MALEVCCRNVSSSKARATISRALDEDRATGAGRYDGGDRADRLPGTTAALITARAQACDRPGWDVANCWCSRGDRRDGYRVIRTASTTTGAAAAGAGAPLLTIEAQMVGVVVDGRAEPCSPGCQPVRGSPPHGGVGRRRAFGTKAKIPRHPPTDAPGLRALQKYAVRWSAVAMSTTGSAWATRAVIQKTNHFVAEAGSVLGPRRWGRRGVAGPPRPILPCEVERSRLRSSRLGDEVLGGGEAELVLLDNSSLGRPRVCVFATPRPARRAPATNWSPQAGCFVGLRRLRPAEPKRVWISCRRRNHPTPARSARHRIGYGPHLGWPRV